MTAKLALALLPLCLLACGGTKDFVYDAGPGSQGSGDGGLCVRGGVDAGFCAAGEKCSMYADGGPVCDAAGTQQAYASCTSDTECAAGTACVDIEYQGYKAGSLCSPFCELSSQPTDGGTTCPGGATCLDLHSGLPEDFCDVRDGG